MKFICTDFWTHLFTYRISKLSTNNSGTFMLTDDKFKFIARLSCEDHSSPMFKSRLRCFEVFIAGLLSGALNNLGIEPNPTVITKIVESQTTLDKKFEMSVTFPKG
mmetsp:Transcript_33705/g.24364  ORF Transcript_33705/g.24364 Transcript_33705/m.24364 type:complete len:106 (+) Transcript_33705:393-710(+)